MRAAYKLPGCLLVVALWGMLVACARESERPSDPRDVVELRWIKAYDRETRDDVETGLLWGLSLLGARLPAGRPVLSWDGDRVTVDLARAEVLPAARPAWRLLLAEIKDSGEYRAHGALDAGRFLALTLGDADRYYALTAVPRRYAEARARYRFEPRAAAVLRSAVARGHRRIEISIAEAAEQIAFVAFEGEGRLDDGSFAAQEIEVLDTLPNGQLRFALYGRDGALKRGASPALTAAGKPAKCMWCHESGLQSTLMDYPAAPGHLDRPALDARISRHRATLSNYRKGLDTQIDYTAKQDHTFAELLYLTFEEPSLERLASEWNIPRERAAELLKDKPTHPQAEFPWLGERLYRRVDVDALAPYVVAVTPSSVREP